MPPTILYNEGWLLRLVLSAAFQGAPCLPFLIEPGAKWFSEALLVSAFRARRRGDALAEASTHADGVVGHFRFLPNSKAGLTLNPSGSQFVILEAKVFSALSKGTTRAPDFDQAARTVACMAEALRYAGQPINRWSSLGFYVLAPRVQIDGGVFQAPLDRMSLRTKIANRIASYEPRDHLEAWQRDWVHPLLSRIQIEAVTWESIIEKILGHDTELGKSIHEFYDLTLAFNGTAVELQEKLFYRDNPAPTCDRLTPNRDAVPERLR